MIEIMKITTDSNPLCIYTNCCTDKIKMLFSMVEIHILKRKGSVLLWKR